MMAFLTILAFLMFAVVILWSERLSKLNFGRGGTASEDGTMVLKGPNVEQSS